MHPSFLVAITQTRLILRHLSRDAQTVNGALNLLLGTQFLYGTFGLGFRHYTFQENGDYPSYGYSGIHDNVYNQTRGSATFKTVSFGVGTYLLKVTGEYALIPEKTNQPGGLDGNSNFRVIVSVNYLQYLGFAK